MDKTKRQLRAEAVERLKAMAEDPTMGSVAVAALGKPANGWEWRDALIDLLADNEPPEGDAPGEFAEILMALAANCSCMGDGIVRHFEPKDVRHEVDELMRVVERDYVLREDYEDAAELCGKHAARIAGLEAGRGPRVNNMTWLFENCGDFRIAVCSELCGNDEWYFDATRRYFGNAMQALEWLTSERVTDAEPVRYPEKYDSWPESGTESRIGGADVIESPAPQAADQVFVPKRQLEPDTREKLEADSRDDIENDIHDYLLYDYAFGTDEFSAGFETMTKWLDRQAAITERECMGGHELTAPVCAECMAGTSRLRVDNAELQSKVDALEAENAENARAINSLGKQRDHWQRVAGKNGEELGKLRRMLEVERNNFEAARKSRDAWMGRFKQAAQHMPVLASDGHPIEIGQTLYGGDGKGWRVIGFERGKSHPVVATSEHSPEVGSVVTRDLKPEWLTHEEPDSLGRIAGELRNIGVYSFPSDMRHVPNAEIQRLAGRIEKMGASYVKVNRF